jgi:hypothetical protein
VCGICQGFQVSPGCMSASMIIILFNPLSRAHARKLCPAMDLTAEERLFGLSLQAINTCRWLCKEILTLRYPLERPSSADPHQPTPPILAGHGMWPLERRASSCGSSRVRPSRGAMSNCRSRQSTICTRGHDHHSEGDDEPAGDHRAHDGLFFHASHALRPLSPIHPGRGEARG